MEITNTYHQYLVGDNQVTQTSPESLNNTKRHDVLVFHVKKVLKHFSIKCLLGVYWVFMIMDQNDIKEKNVLGIKIIREDKR